MHESIILSRGSVRNTGFFRGGVSRKGICLIDVFKTIKNEKLSFNANESDDFYHKSITCYIKQLCFEADEKKTPLHQWRTLHD